MGGGTYSLCGVKNTSSLLPGIWNPSISDPPFTVFNTFGVKSCIPDDETYLYKYDYCPGALQQCHCSLTLGYYCPAGKVLS